MLPPLSSVPVSSAWSMPACTLSARRGWPSGCGLLQLRIPVISWEETNPLCQRRWTAQPFAKANISPALSGESELLQELFVFASFKERMNVPPRTNIFRGGCEEGQLLQELPSWLLVPLQVSFTWHRGIYPSLSSLCLGLALWLPGPPTPGAWSWLPGPDELQIQTDPESFRRSWSPTYGCLWHTCSPRAINIGTVNILGMVVLCCEGLPCAW